MHDDRSQIQPKQCTVTQQNTAEIVVLPHTINSFRLEFVLFHLKYLNNNELQNSILFGHSEKSKKKNNPDDIRDNSVLSFKTYANQ